MDRVRSTSQLLFLKRYAALPLPFVKQIARKPSTVLYVVVHVDADRGTANRVQPSRNELTMN